MASVSLPDLPKEEEFEDYISALFQSSGYYIERNIIERDVEDVLELDIVITDYGSFPPKIKLLEVKSGKWGFRDMFKVKGWMDYCNIPKGMLIANKKKNYVNIFKKRARKLNIDLIIIPNLEKSKKILPGIVYVENSENIDIPLWRFSYWVERNLLKCLNHKKKSCPGLKRFKALEDYYFELNNGIFFTENIIERICKLYSTFQKFPLISAKCGNELIGNPFNGECNTLPEKIYDETYYKCDYNDIQISTFVEHRARVAILKSAIDYKLYKKAGDENRTKDKIIDVLEIAGITFETKLLDLLPKSFKEGLDTLSKHEYFQRYPVFWQWFMWVFGGFILKDYEEQEYEILSKKTGIPVEEIPNALDSYQLLFPHEGGWFRDLSPNSNIKIMKVFPVPFMGIGANYRIACYTESENFKDLELTGAHTSDDLAKWNNLTIKVLRKK